MSIYNVIRNVALGVVAFAPALAWASPNLVVNGNFEQTTMYDAQGNFTPSQITSNNVTGWSTTGYNFIFGAGTASTVGSTGQYGQLSLWSGSDVPGGPVLGSSPTGGNFVGADGAFQSGAITQTLNGLTIGGSYAVSFDWAGAQQSGYTGDTTEQWVVGLGTQTQATPVVPDASHGFTGWVHQTFIFQANAVSEVLSFLAVGTPAGVPPFSVLDGVSARAVTVPEPASLVLMLGGIGIVGALAVARRAKKGAV